MSSIPPLPDYLDVEAAEMPCHALSSACELMAGSCKVVKLQGLDHSGPNGGPVVELRGNGDFLTPHACIARWAGEDGNRWDFIDDELRAMIDWPESMEPWMFDPAGSAYALSTATPTQLYRALVNAGWNPWRTKYNKQREAAEVRDESE